MTLDPITWIIIGSASIAGVAIVIISIVEISKMVIQSIRDRRHLRRHLANTASLIDEALARGDDGERIVVYRRPSSPSSLRKQALFLLFLALYCDIAGVLSFVFPQAPYEPARWAGSMLIFGLACLLLVIALVPLVRKRDTNPRPVLIVNADGIIERCSNSKGGMGLVPWNEIAWVGHEIEFNNTYIMQFLVIHLYQSPDASADQPRTVVPSPSAPYPFTTSVLRINTEFLDMPAAEIVYQTERYIKRHVPPGWHGALSDERGDDGPIIDKTEPVW